MSTNKYQYDFCSKLRGESGQSSSQFENVFHIDTEMLLFMLNKRQNPLNQQSIPLLIRLSHAN